MLTRKEGKWFEVVEAPAYMNFDRNRKYTYYPADGGPERVWQYFEEYGKWYVCSRNMPEISDLILTEADWQFVSGGAGFPWIPVALACVGIAVIAYFLLKK